MAFIIFFFLKKFEKIEKTGIISTKLSLRCTPSVILGGRWSYRSNQNQKFWRSYLSESLLDFEASALKKFVLAFRFKEISIYLYIIYTVAVIQVATYRKLYLEYSIGSSIWANTYDSHTRYSSREPNFRLDTHIYFEILFALSINSAASTVDTK